MGKNTKSEEEIKKCEICEGTGIVATMWLNPITHMSEPDGEETCICVLDDHEIDEDYVYN